MHLLTTTLRRAGRVDHALRAVLALDGADARHPRKLSELLQRSPGPEKFLAAILGRLRQEGIVASTRGSRGGYWLTRPLTEITVLDVVEAMSATDAADADHSAAAETDVRPIVAVTTLWDEVDHRVREVLGTTRLADLLPPDG